MQYETLLFTRNQREDFTAFIRPGELTNKDVSAIGGIFNYISDISRLKAAFPSLYFFPLGEYLLLLRHYDSGRKHAGRAIGVIEGIAVPRRNSAEFARALPAIIEQQAAVLDVIGTLDDIESLETATSPAQTWSGQALDRDPEDFVSEFLTRRAADRLFLPFTPDGRDMLITTLCDGRLTPPPFFAFGTNSDVLAQLDRQAPVDIASFFKTEDASFRNRKTNRVVQRIGDDLEATDMSMALRTVARDEMRLRPQPSDVHHHDEEEDEDTLVGSNAVSIRPFRSEKPARAPVEIEDEDAAEPTVLTMRQMRDRALEREREGQLAQATEDAETPKRPVDPIHWLLNLVSSILSPNKPK